MVKFTDNSEKILQAFCTQTGVALNLIGSQATKHMQKNTPVRTGNLVNHGNWEVDADEESVVVGFEHDENSDKDPYYAVWVENGGKYNNANHMLKRAMTEHSEEYSKIIKQAMKG